MLSKVFQRNTPQEIEGINSTTSITVPKRLGIWIMITVKDQRFHSTIETLVNIYFTMKKIINTTGNMIKIIFSIISRERIRVSYYRMSVPYHRKS